MHQIEEDKEFEHKIPKVVNFGRNMLLLNKLYYNYILRVKDPKMHSIENMPNKHVSDNFVKTIDHIYNNKKYIEDVNFSSNDKNDFIDYICERIKYKTEDRHKKRW